MLVTRRASTAAPKVVRALSTNNLSKSDRRELTGFESTKQSAWGHWRDVCRRADPGECGCVVQFPSLNLHCAPAATLTPCRCCSLASCHITLYLLFIHRTCVCTRLVCRGGRVEGGGGYRWCPSPPCQLWRAFVRDLLWHHVWLPALAVSRAALDRLSYGFLLEDMFRGMWIATESMLRPKVRAVTPKKI